MYASSERCLCTNDKYTRGRNLQSSAYFLFLVSLLGYSIGVFKLIAYIAAPWSISRGIINGLMMIEAFKNFARLDVEKRIAQREQQNRHGVQNGNATSIKNGEVARGDNHAHQN